MFVTLLYMSLPCEPIFPESQHLPSIISLLQFSFPILVFPCLPIRVHPRPSAVNSPLFAYFTPFAVQPPPRPIKAKTPAIVPHQGISRHPLKNESSPPRRAIPTRHAPSPPSLDVGRSMLDVGCWMLDVGCWMFPPAAPSASIRVHLR